MADTLHGAGSIEHAVNKQLAKDDDIPAEEFVDYSAVSEDEEHEDGELSEDPPAPEGPPPRQADSADKPEQPEQPAVATTANESVVDDDDDDDSDDTDSFQPPVCPYLPGGKRSTVELTILAWGDAHKGYKQGNYWYFPGFKSSRLYASAVRPGCPTVYVSYIEEGPDGLPRFCVVADDDKECVYSSTLPTPPWTEIKLKVNELNKVAVTAGGSVSGPDQFGFAVRAPGTKGSNSSVHAVLSKMGMAAEAQGVVMRSTVRKNPTPRQRKSAAANITLAVDAPDMRSPPRKRVSISTPTPSAKKFCYSEDISDFDSEEEEDERDKLCVLIKEEFEKAWDIAKKETRRVSLDKLRAAVMERTTKKRMHSPSRDEIRAVVAKKMEHKLRKTAAKA
jgi:hypothetical protein